MKDQLFSRTFKSEKKADLPFKNNNLALCIDNSDNQMTFVGHIVYLCPS